MGIESSTKKIAPENKIDREIAEIENDLSDDENSKRLEDVRMSNFAYSQTKISEYISFYFAMLGVGCAVIGSEMCASFNDNG